MGASLAGWILFVAWTCISGPITAEVKTQDQSPIPLCQQPSGWLVNGEDIMESHKGNASRLEELYGFYLEAGLRELSLFIINSHDSQSVQLRGELENQVNLIPVYQDIANDSVWESLKGGKDDIYVYDRCGLLAAYIPYPLSLLSEPYSEAAILHAYFNDPCGMCPITFNEYNDTVNGTNLHDQEALLRHPNISRNRNPSTGHGQHHGQHLDHDSDHNHHDHQGQDHDSDHNHHDHQAQDHKSNHSHHDHQGHDDHHGHNVQVAHDHDHSERQGHGHDHGHGHGHGQHRHGHGQHVRGNHSQPHSHDNSNSSQDGHNHDSHQEHTGETHNVMNDDAILEKMVDIIMEYDDIKLEYPEETKVPIVDFWEPVEEIVLGEDETTTVMTTALPEDKIIPRRQRRHRTHLPRSQHRIDVEDTDSSICPDVPRPLCNEWRRKFRLSKHCCQALDNVDGDLDQIPTSCSFITQSKCNKMTWLLGCCRRRALEISLATPVPTTMPPTTTTMPPTTTTMLPPDPTIDPCKELARFCPNMLANLGFTSSVCCPELAQVAKKMYDEGVSFPDAMCQRFDERLCYNVHFNRLEHRCCPMMKRVKHVGKI